MQGSDGFQRFAGAGLELLGIDADEIELAVMEAASTLYRPNLDALLEADLDDIEPEVHIDPSGRPS
jgi:hypothetical protein